MAVTHLQGDCRDVLRTLPERSVHCCVTSPPYWGLRDYGIPPSVWGGDPACEHDWSIEEIKTEKSGGNWAQQTNGRGEVQGEPADFRAIDAGVQRRGFCRKCQAWLGVLGLEPSPEIFIEHAVEVFREVRRVLRDDGTLWLNIGDSYANDGKWGGYSGGKHIYQGEANGRANGRQKQTTGLKPRDLVGIPWMLAFALRADGWYLRQEIIWHKPGPMPESVRDRCCKAHEPIFLLAKSRRYYFDLVAIEEPASGRKAGNKSVGKYTNAVTHRTKQGRHKYEAVATRNKRTVWRVASRSYKGAHFAVFPPKLIEPCILAGTSAAGCCAKCGTPLVRIVERERVPTRPGADTKIAGMSGLDAENPHEKQNGLIVGNRDPLRHVTRKVTKGWKPACACDPKTFQKIPCTVLDPFGGSGTTAEVAQKLGCHAILIELNPEYIALQRKRVEQGSLLTASGS